jgi:hypothetical protein
MVARTRVGWPTRSLDEARLEAAVCDGDPARLIFAHRARLATNGAAPQARHFAGFPASTQLSSLAQFLARYQFWLA